MSDTFRAYGRVEQLVRTSPRAAATAAKVMFERDARQRVDRLRDAAIDRIQEKGRPKRARMRALVARPGGRLEWRDVPEPRDPGPGGAVVHPLAVATCDLDRPMVLGATPFPLPLHLGHECVAEVVRVGDEVTGVRPGDKVVVPFEISCGRCAMCRAGLTANCTTVPPVSMYGFGLTGGHWGGAYSDLLAVPFADAMLVRLPEGIEPVAAASVADTICDGWRHVGPELPELFQREPDAEVLIIAGLAKKQLLSASAPLYAGQIALALGVRRVIFADARAHVRDEAAKLGMEAITPRKLRRIKPVSQVVEISGTPRGLWTALSKTAPDGVCSSGGSLHYGARIPASLLYGRNVSLHIGRAHTRTIIPHVLDLMTKGILHPEGVTTQVGALDDAPRALRTHMFGTATKTILTI